MAANRYKNKSEKEKKKERKENRGKNNLHAKYITWMAKKFKLTKFIDEIYSTNIILEWCNINK